MDLELAEERRMPEGSAGPVPGELGTSGQAMAKHPNLRINDRPTQIRGRVAARNLLGARE